MSRYLTISHMCYVEVHVEEHVKEHGEDSDRFKVMGTTGAAGLQRPPRLKAGRGTSPFFDHIIDKHKPMRDFQYRMLALVSQKYFRISKRISTLAGSQELFWLAAGHRNWREGGRGGERGGGEGSSGLRQAAVPAVALVAPAIMTSTAILQQFN